MKYYVKEKNINLRQKRRRVLVVRPRWGWDVDLTSERAGVGCQ